jgi:hypothetical protein
MTTGARNRTRRGEEEEDDDVAVDGCDSGDKLWGGNCEYNNQKLRRQLWGKWRRTRGGGGGGSSLIYNNQKRRQQLWADCGDNGGGGGGGARHRHCWEGGGSGNGRLIGGHARAGVRS